MLKTTGVLTLSALGLAGQARAQTAAIPTEPTLYRIHMTGQTSNGPFDREGLFLISPSVESTPTNPRDVALVSGNPRGAPEVGSIEFYTNTALRTSLNTGGNPTLNDAAIKTGTVQTDDASGRLQAYPRDDQGVDLPPGVRATLQVNVFTPRSGIVAPLYELTDGLLDVQFQPGNRIAGTIAFTGISLGGAATRGAITAQFVGAA